MKRMFGRLKESLLTVEPEVWHYKAWEESDRYIVWAEDGEESARWTNNEMAWQEMRGKIAYFIKGEDNEAIGRMQKALTDAGVKFSLSSVSYDEDTNYVCFMWLFYLRVAWRTNTDIP